MPGSAIMTGAIAGAIAGIVFAMFEMIVAEIQGNGFFMPLRMIGAIVLGEEALQPSYSLASAASAGMAVHMMLSVIYGVVFAVILTALPSIQRSAPLLLLSGDTLWLCPVDRELLRCRACRL